MKEKRTIKLIRQKVSEGVINGNRLTPADLRRIGIKQNTSTEFMPKHRKNNPDNNTELFERISRGVYRLIDW